MGDSGGDEPMWKYVVSSIYEDPETLVCDNTSEVGWAVETLAEDLMHRRDEYPDPEPIKVTIKKLRPSEIEEAP